MGGGRQRWKDLAGRHAPIALVLLGLALLYRSLHEQGHDWGDDFSLYINQARGLVRGDVAQVASDVRFALDNSGVSTFSPNLYPWGFPLLLAPLYLLFGLDYMTFKLVGVLALCGFLLCYHLLLERRLRPIPALALVALIATSTSYATWTNTVLSDLPSLCMVGVTLVWIDRCRDRGLLAGPSRRPLVVLGLLLGFAFSIRRETIALVVALAALHAAYVAHAWWQGRTWAAVLDLPWRRLLLPYGVAAAFVVALQLTLPSSLTFDRDGGGLGSIWPNAQWYLDVFAEHVGAKDPGDQPIALFGGEALGAVAVGAMLGLAVIGLVGRLVVARTRDLAMAVHLVVTALAVGVQPFKEGRYLFAITPFVAYFAYQALPTLVAALTWLRRRRGAGPAPERAGRVATAAAYAPLVLFVPLVASNADDFAHAVDYHRTYDYVIQGPETASAQEMFAAVERCTRGDDVVVFARARSMVLYTGRRSIQTGGEDEAVQRADWLALSNSDVDYSEPSIDVTNAAQYGAVRVWHNDEYSLFRVGPARLGVPAACPAEGTIELPGEAP